MRLHHRYTCCRWEAERVINTDITHTHSIFYLKHEAYRRLLFTNKSRVFHEEIIFQLLFKFKGFITESFVTARPNVLNLHPHLPPLRLTGAHWNQRSYLLIKSQHMLHFTLFSDEYFYQQEICICFLLSVLPPLLVHFNL